MLDLVIWAVYAAILYISFFLLLTFLEDGEVREELERREDYPSLTLLVPAYNEEDTIADTIESALEVDYPSEKYEIIVINDGSTDSTREIAEEYAERGEITLVNQENAGKGAALNAGLEHADTELVACVDADSVLNEDSLKDIVSDMSPGAAGVASAMKVHEPKNLIQRLQWMEYIVGIFMRHILGLIDAINVTPGPLSVYDREKIEAVGGFDEDSMVEDQEMCFRLQEQHWSIDHSRHGEVHTVAPDNWRDFMKQRYRWYRGSLENIVKYRHMLFNPRYGDFGMFAVPSKAVQGFLSIAGLFLMLYITLKPVATVLRDFTRIGFRVFSVPDLTLSELPDMAYWWLLGQDVMTTTLIGALMVFSIFLAFVAARHTEENVFEHGYLAPVVYVFWYFLIIGAAWTKSTFDFITRSEKKW